MSKFMKKTICIALICILVVSIMSPIALAVTKSGTITTNKPSGTSGHTTVSCSVTADTRYIGSSLRDCFVVVMQAASGNRVTMSYGTLTNNPISGASFTRSGSTSGVQNYYISTRDIGASGTMDSTNVSYLKATSSALGTGQINGGTVRYN